MRKSKVKSESSLRSLKSEQKVAVEIYSPPLDELSIKVLGLQLTEVDIKYYSIKVTFFDQLLINNIITPVHSRDPLPEECVATGHMNYDPSDYEKMCLFADSPLIVTVQALNNIESSTSEATQNTSTLTSLSKDSYCCNIDILSLFIDQDKICARVRLQQLHKPSVQHQISWNNLPLISLELSVKRNEENSKHHVILREANYMKVTVIAAYNLIVPYDPEVVYTAASKTPWHNDINVGTVTFNQGYYPPRRFKCTELYPKWESLNTGDDTFAEANEKTAFKLEDILNDSEIDLNHYFNSSNRDNTVVWGSFHRTLILSEKEKWIWNQFRRYCWPLEVHLYGDHGVYSFMGFMNLFKLLYPGENVIRLAVPLFWINREEMEIQCGCELLLFPNDKTLSTTGTTVKPSKATTDSVPTSTITDLELMQRPTGADDGRAFVIVEVKMARPLKKTVIPPVIPGIEIDQMLINLEEEQVKRECSGRGQLQCYWKSTVKSAANALRKVPYYGMTEFCSFNRQLSETRTRVELITSFWQDAAIYVNNNFVLQDYLQSNNTFEELLMMSHACLMRSAYEALVGKDEWSEVELMLKAARHARQLQDVTHAVDLYLQLVAENPHNPNHWRELAVCLLDVDVDWAEVCINKSIFLDPRHPLTILVKACTVFEKNPDMAEPFFIALLAHSPFWTTSCMVAQAYYINRELFYMADEVMNHVYKLGAEGLIQEGKYPRSWEYELGDWWDSTPLLPGMSRYYDAADALLRIRAVKLAEICLARALAEVGETAAYFHLAALCCRLKGDIEDALCHLKIAIDKFGEINYLKSLQAECLHKYGDHDAAMAAYVKAGSNMGTYSILLSLPSREPSKARSSLVDLLRRHPNAYAWICLANDWLTRLPKKREAHDVDGMTDEQKGAITCAIACAVQALKCDRRASRAWALLAKLVQPQARRLYCKNMASMCGYDWESENLGFKSTELSTCYYKGTALRECRCDLCEHIIL